MTWDPQQYLSFGGHRFRPALDLIAQIPHAAPASIVDLGCGTGSGTLALKARWPEARLTGLDTSPEMLAKAREADPDIDWREGDLAGWEPPEPVDLLYSNAVLHWVDDHGTVLPNLLRRLRPDGVLAIQMPRNFAAPSHQAYMEIAQTPRWRTALEHLIRGEPTQPPAFYYDLLTPLTQSLDIWETEYVQVLDGENPVPDYVKGTSLKPFLDALAEPERTQFEDEYRAKVLKSYPPQSDGKTLFPFRRLFIMARL